MPDAVKKISSRIHALDLMRGYFLLCLVIDHLYFWPNGLDFLSARGQLFVSAAEGFFLISGIVLGIVRGQKLISQPFKVPAWLLVKRGIQLYITAIILALVFTFVGWAFIGNPGLKEGIAAPGTPLLHLIWNTLTFNHLYGWADYLRLYALFLFASPLVLWLLRKGKWWIGLAASIAVWALSPNVGYPESLGMQPFKWQLIFFGGLIIGFHWKQLTGYWQRIPILWRKTIIVSLVGVSLATLIANLFIAFGGYLGHDIYTVVAPIRDHLQKYFFDKEQMPLTRLLLFTAWFWASFWLFRRFEPFIIKYFGWLLLPFGTNSLYAYTVHAFFVFFVHLLVPAGSTAFFINFVLSWGILALIWLMIRHQILFKIIPR